MDQLVYYYCTLRYVHDAVADEALNIGVLLYAPDAPQPFLDVRVDERFKRLSAAFATFDGEHYRQVLRNFRSSLERVKRQASTGLPGTRTEWADLEAIVRHIWPDQDLSYRCGPVLAGLTHDPEDELDYLFHRYVVVQYERHKDEKRTDPEVWTAVYRQPLAKQSVAHRLEPRKIGTDEFSMVFEHTFKNGAINALQPISFDLSKPENITRKAAKWRGYVSELGSDPNLGTLYILLGKPELSSHRDAYEKGKKILDRIAVRHEIIEEQDAEKLAKNVADMLKAHDDEEAKANG